MIRISIISALICPFLGCKSAGSVTGMKMFRDSIPIVTFCDLPEFAGKSVYLKSYYGGIDEYWSLRNPKKKTCDPELHVDLQFTGDNPFMPPEKFKKIFREVHDNDHNTYLFIEAVGIFEQDPKKEYGHLGSNNSRFIVSEIIEATLVRQ